MPSISLSPNQRLVNVTSINCGTSTPKLGGSLNISFFPNLTSFTCSNNNISSIGSLSNNPFLQTLRLENNNITSIGIASNPSLQTLRLENNNITSPDIESAITSIYNNRSTIIASTNKNIDFQLTGTSMGTPSRTARLNNVNQYQALLDAVGFNVTYRVNGETEQTWNGGGADNNFSTSANWANSLSPTGYDSLYFGGSTRLSPVNNLVGDPSFNGITFNAGAGAFTLSGNRFRLVFDGINNNSASTQTISNDIILQGPTRTINCNAGNILLSGTLSDLKTFLPTDPATSIVKTGTGILTLSGDSNYLGSTTIQEGTLRIGNGGTTGSIGSTSSIINNGVLEFNRSNELTVAAVISGSGALQKSGAGKLILSGSSTYTGNTAVSTGILETSVANRLPDNTTVAVSSGATLQLGGDDRVGSISGEGNYSLGAFTLRNGENNISTTVSGVISGTGGKIEKRGGGTLTLSGTNTFTGGLLIYAGTVSVSAIGSSGAASRTGVGNISLGTFSSSGTLLYNGSGETTNKIFDLTGTNTAISSITNNGTGTLTLTANFTSSVPATKTLQISGSNNTVVSGIISDSISGSVVVTSQANSGATTLNLGSTVGIVGGAAVSGAGIGPGTTVQSVSTNSITLTTPTTATILQGATVNISGVLNPTNFTKIGTGDLTLSGINTYTGTTNISNGRLIISDAQSLNSSSQIITGSAISGSYRAVLDFNSAIALTPPIDMSVCSTLQGSGTINSNISINNLQIINGSSLTTPLTLGTGTFTRTASSLLNIRGNVISNMTGLSSHTNGILGPWAVYGTGTSIRYAQRDGTTGIISGLTGTAAATGAAVTDTTGTLNYDVAANSGTFPAGASVNTLRFSSTASGTITGALKTNGLLNVSSTNARITLSGNISNGSRDELFIIPVGPVTLSGIVSDNSPTNTCRLIVSQPYQGTTGGLTLSGNNTYSGGTFIINSNIIVRGTNNALGSGPVTVLRGGPPDSGSGAASVEGGYGGMLVLAENLTISNPINISGQGHGSYSGAIRNLSGDNTITGVITCGDGATRIQCLDGRLIINNDIIVNTSSTNLFQPINGDIHLGSSCRIISGTSITIGIITTTTAPIKKFVTLGATNIFPINSTLSLGVSGQDAPGQLDLNGYDQTFVNVISNGTSLSNNRITNSSPTLSTLTINNSTSITASNTFSGNLSLIKTGVGIMTLSSNNTYTGTTFIQGGTLRVTALIAGPTVKFSQADFTSTSLVVTFSSPPSAGETYKLLPGPTGQSYSAISLIGVSNLLTATYNSTTSTLTIN